MRTALATAFLLFTTGLTAVAADEKPLDRAEIDKRAARVAHDAAVAGTELFNKGDHGGCFRLYQGTLQALLPMLDHQPKLAATVKEKLDKAKTMRATDGAFALRDALDAVMGEKKAPGGSDAPVTKKPLWDRLGGEKAVRAVVHDFAAAAAADPKVNVTRDGKFKLDEKGVEHLEQLLVEFISANTGGPLKYTGRDMKTVHKGMGITDAEFDAAAGHLIAVLKKHNVPQADIDELVAIVGSTRKDIVEEKK